LFNNYNGSLKNVFALLFLAANMGIRITATDLKMFAAGKIPEQLVQDSLKVTKQSQFLCEQLAICMQLEIHPA